MAEGSRLQTTLRATAVFCPLACLGAGSSLSADQVEVIRPRIDTAMASVIEGRNIAFQRLPAAGLSQTRVAEIAQDADGFLWFGTQSGLNRFDGYKCKVFKHDPRQPASLSGVFLYSLFTDRSGGLWVGSDQYLDRFDAQTETFHRIRLATATASRPILFTSIGQDRSGTLWFPTSDGLYGLNPVNGRVVHYRHDPNDPTSFHQREVQAAYEDSSGTFWVGMSGGFDILDRQSGKVRQRIEIENSGYAAWIHEDRFHVFWVRDGSGFLGILDRKRNVLTRFAFGPPHERAESRVEILEMLEDRDGTMWFGTLNRGLLKYDRERNVFIEYAHHAGDPDSLPENRVIRLFQDREGNIWAGLHQNGPVFFNPRPPQFEKFTYQPGNPDSLGSALVSVIHEDREGALWIGADRLIKRIDRRTGKYSTFDAIRGHEVLSIVEQGPDVMWMGTAGLGLKRYDRKTGQIKTYLNPNTPSGECSDLIEKLLIDRKGRLWEAAWGGLCYLDLSTGKFTSFPEMSANRTYHAIAEDSDGIIWLGSSVGLQRLDPATGGVTAFVHGDDPSSISDNRINSIYQAADGTLWIGTQNGLDRFDSHTGRFAHFGEKDGIAGNVVSCILEDKRNRLWMSTNAGISSFDRSNRRIDNYTVADGLPGPDLTGWGACFESKSGEMFFGGFSGAAAFYPDRITNPSYAAPVVLTGFRLFGSLAEPGSGSPLKQSITRSPNIVLSSRQNIFSIEFSALSYADPASNRFRYRLEPLQSQWAEVNGDQRLASYTTLPPGDYTFRAEGATSRGPWSAPGATLHIRVLPAWWATWWFRSIVALLTGGTLFALYLLRIRYLSARMRSRIREQKLEEEILRASQRDLSLIINTIPAMAWSARTDGAADFFNRHYLEYVGLASEQAVGWGWSATIHPDDLPALAEYWKFVIASGQPGEAEARVRRVDGVYRWFLFRANPLRDESGNIVKWYGTNTDIQARKEAEEELQRSEEKHRVVVETASDAVLSMDEEGVILLANPATKAIFGYEPADLIGKTMTALMPESMAGLHEASFRRYLGTGERHLNWRGAEVTARRSDGSEFPAEVSLGVMENQGRKVFTGFIRDITEKKSGEEALRTSERDLRLMIETIPGLVWCVASNGDLNYVNRRLLNYTGGTLNDWAKGGWSKFLHPNDVEPMVSAWWSAVSAGKIHDLQCRLRRFDGVYRWFQMFGQAALDDDGVVTRWYGLLLDIDERKNVEEALRDTQTRLTRATQTATVGEFAAAIAHEINQPLAAVVANAHACLRWLSAEPPGVSKAYGAAERIARDGKEAGEVLRRIRALFRQTDIEKADVDMNEVIRDVIRLLANEAARRRVSVGTDLAARLPLVTGDAVQLQQVVFNLLTNAIEALDSVPDRPRRLFIRSRLPSPETVLVEVEDSGPGLADAEKIFEAFFTTKETGMGMGLAICRSIIAGHDGRLWADSVPDVGTKFSFCLPAGSGS